MQKINNSEKGKTMKACFERNGQLVECDMGFNGALSREGKTIRDEMVESDTDGWVEYNLYLVRDDFDFENQKSAGGNGQ